MKISKISLDTKICDLKVAIKGTYVEKCLEQLKGELHLKGLKVNPKVWVSSDWFCPDGHTGFAVPFYLLSRELMDLEKSVIGEAEGEGRDWCMMLMRHEMGHVLDNAFGLRKRKKRQLLFGLSSIPYPDRYRPDIYSRHFVRNLDGYYAQAHPDEDWSETFAVWLNPRIKWRKAYAHWPALEKLEYIDSVMEDLAFQKPLRRNTQTLESIKEDSRTLREYYLEKTRRLKTNHRQKEDASRPMVMM